MNLSAQLRDPNYLIRFRLTAALVLLLFSFPSQAVQMLGVVTYSENMPEFQAGTPIYLDTEISTDQNQRVVIKTNDGDRLVANRNSKIRIVKPGFFSQLFGKIYYLIAPKRQNTVTVQTQAATIGIRGTRFVVDTDTNQPTLENVALVEGKLNFDSNDDESFALYQERELSEFEKYKLRTQKDFNAFKQQMTEEFIAYKKSIELEAGFALKFDGKKVVRAKVDQELLSTVDELEQLLADIEQNQN